MCSHYNWPNCRGEEEAQQGVNEDADAALTPCCQREAAAQAPSADPL